MIMLARLTVEELQPIARNAVSRYMHAWLKRVGYYEDAVQAVWMALVKAQGLFDPARGIPEGAYLKRRAKGAVLDYTGMLSFRRRHGGNGGAAGATVADCRKVYWAQNLPPPWHKAWARNGKAEQAAISEEFKNRFFKAFGANRQHYARILWEHAANGLTQKEAGALEGLSEPRVSGLVKLLQHGNQKWACKVRGMLQKEWA